MAPPANWLDGTTAALRPPPKLSLSEWADLNYRMSAESSAAPGRWHTRPYQRGILDAISDPAVERVSIIKSARIGYTHSINAAIGYFMDHDPCPIMVVQPTVDTAKKYSKEFIAPMLRDVPVLVGLVKGAAVKSSGNTILDKEFPGGVLSLVGANSGSGFRMSSRRVVIFDEVDGYPPSAGDEGDPIKLGENRARDFWNRKIIAGSTPLTAGASRIEEMFQAGDRRRFHVPCPHCGHMDFLRFNAAKGGEDDGIDGRGHLMRWPKGKPDEACFMCSSCGCAIEESSKRAMLEAGKWRAEGEFTGHASFHIWAAYSLSPNTTWGSLAAEFVEAARLGPEKLKTFVNTALGETWKERGEAPDWERLHQRREPYAIGTVPDGPIVLTAGVDVQQDRFVYEVVGWAASKESWSVEAGEIHGDTADEATWAKLDVLLARDFPGADGMPRQIASLAVDSGFRAQMAYTWARQHPMPRVIAVKGASRSIGMIIGTPSPVDVNVRGKRLQRGYKVWPVGGDLAKSELYGWLRLRLAEDGTAPPGYCHFPEYPESYFEQLTAEHLVTIVNRRTRRAKLEWQVLPNRENHYLDARVYARAAAAVLGIDRMTKPVAPAPSSTGAPVRHESSPSSTPTPRRGSWLSGPTPARGGWLGRRR